MEHPEMDMYAYERFLADGKTPFCGVDEAGRGPLAGPVCAAAVLLPEGLVIPGLNDSKKLTAKKRDALYDIICESAVAFGIAFATVEEIEALNIKGATYLAMNRAIADMEPAPVLALVDGNDKNELDIPAIKVVKGDSLCASIAAASVLAKVTRDRYMDDMDALQTVSDVEQAALVNKLIAGDASASTPLVESKLKKVADIAKKYCGKGVTFGDLIQEGNLELMVAVSEYTKECGDFNNYIDKRIEQGIRNVINSQINSDRIGQHLADKLNQLDNTTSKLSKELGRVPEISELADAMGITEDEASLLLKTSLDTLSVNQDTQITDAKTAEEIAKEGTVSLEDLINNNSVSADGFMGQSYASTDDSMDITKPASGSDPLTWRKHTR